MIPLPALIPSKKDKVNKWKKFPETISEGSGKGFVSRRLLSGKAHSQI